MSQQLFFGTVFAQVVGVMGSWTLFLISMIYLSAFRTFIRKTGQLPDEIISLVVSLLLVFLFAVELKFVFAAFALMTVSILQKTHSQRAKKPLPDKNIIDQTLLIMKTGRSFENALALIPKDSISESNMKVFKACTENPSQAYQILNHRREFLKIYGRLEEKQKSATMQARVQAWVCVVLFGTMCLAQWLINPFFKQYMLSFAGRGLFLLSLCLLVCGVYLVLKMSRMKRFNV